MREHIILDDRQYKAAVKVGKARRNSYIKSDDDRFEPENSEKAIRNEIVGAGGELALCIYIGVEWPATVDTFTAVQDTPVGEVRTSRDYVAKRHGIPVKQWEPRKKPDMAICGVVVNSKKDRLDEYYIAGWIKAREAPGIGELYSTRKGDRPAHYWIELGDLHDAEELL